MTFRCHAKKNLFNSTMMIRFATVLPFVICFFSYTYASKALRGFIDSHSVAPGLSFTRTIRKVPGSFDLRFDGNNCGSTDDHGDNDCHFHWGDDVTGVYKMTIANDIDKTDKMEGHFKVRKNIYIQNYPVRRLAHSCCHVFTNFSTKLR